MLVLFKKFSAFGVLWTLLVIGFPTGFLPGGLIGSMMGPVPALAQQLPLPRMVSLRAEEVNVRTGPGVQYPVKWIFKARSMPIEIIAEYDTWRKIRDFEGEEGWIHRAMLTGKRALIVIDSETNMMEDPVENAVIVARLAMGMIAEIEECNNSWCYVNTRGYDGWVVRTAVWGVYPHEIID